MGQIAQNLKSSGGSSDGNQTITDNLFGGGVRGGIASELDTFGKAMSNYANSQAQGNGNAGTQMLTNGVAKLGDALVTRRPINRGAPVLAPSTTDVAATQPNVMPQLPSRIPTAPVFNPFSIDPRFRR